MIVSASIGKTVAENISEFVARTTTKNIPSSVRKQAELHLLDGLATMIGGAKESSSRILRRHFRVPVKSQAATVLGAVEKFCAEHAALLNGVQGHVLDYDDVQLATLPSRPAGQQTHPTTPVLAAVLALAESRGTPGPALLDSYIVGVEVACRLGDAVHPDHYLSGSHPTGTLAVFGAAAACAHLLKLGKRSIRETLGIAGTLSSGLRANRGTMAKGLNAGHAAQNGVLAATLANEDFSASQNIFDDPMGFFPAMCGNQVDRNLLRFGDPFFFDSPGVALKLYPCAGVLHPALDLAFDLRRQCAIQANKIARIRVTLDENAASPLVYDSPKDSLQAKFSLNFALAVAMVDGQAGLKQFAVERVRDSSVRALMKRVQLARRPRRQERHEIGIDTEVVIALKSGAIHRARASIARGHPGRPASRAEIEDKFRQCARDVLRARVVEKFFRNFSKLERAPSIISWLRPLRPARR
jgi:2-methylcitrate dehydratase PrpD